MAMKLIHNACRFCGKMVLRRRSMCSQDYHMGFGVGCSRMQTFRRIMRLRETRDFGGWLKDRMKRSGCEEDQQLFLLVILSKIMN